MLKHLSKESFLPILRECVGLIPVSLDVNSSKMIWMDMEGYHFYEGFFHKSIQIFSKLKKDSPTVFTTDLEIMRDENILAGYVYPSGFIFHAGRSGSTALVKAIARSKENLVVSEAQPHNSIWNLFTNNGKTPLDFSDDNKIIYKNLILAMGRRRENTTKHHLIKFTSFNIRFFNFIHSVFSDVPAIFLSRDISEILRSWGQDPPGWLFTERIEQLKMLTGHAEPELEKIIKGFCEAASIWPSTILKPFNYTDVKPENLESILEFLNIKSNEKEMTIMKSQFSFDSKVDFGLKAFIRAGH